MIGVGVVGAGAAALTAHLPAIGANARLRLVGICDSDERRLEEALVRFPTEGFSEVGALFATPGLDAVVVATPPQSHLSIAQAAIRARKHILCEKPLARTVGECKQLIAEAADAGVVLGVGHEKRFHPTLRRIRDLLRADSIGEPFFGGIHWAAAAKLDPERLIPAGFRHGYEWRWRDPTVGGGLVQDHLPHYVDLIRFWLDQEPTEVQAHVFNVGRDLLGWSPDQSVWEDFGVALVHLSGGFVLRFETSVVGRSISPIWSLGSGRGEWTEYGYLLGTRGQLVFDLLPWDSTEHGRIALNRIGGDGWVSIEQPEPERRWGGAARAMFEGQLAAWVDAIEGRASDVALGSDGLICLAAVEAVYQAAAQKTTVRI